MIQILTSELGNLEIHDIKRRERRIPSHEHSRGAPVKVVASVFHQKDNVAILILLRFSLADNMKKL